MIGRTSNKTVFCRLHQITQKVDGQRKGKKKGHTVDKSTYVLDKPRHGVPIDLRISTRTYF